MGGAVVHFELWSRDPERVGKFYAEVFDWKVQHVPELKYRMVDTGGQGGINGGIMQPEEGPVPGNQAFYIAVDTLANARERIVAAGGSILVERQEVPGMGAFCLFADPEGRVNGCWEMAPPAQG